MLMAQLQVLEFSARVTLQLRAGTPPIENLLALKRGEWVAVTPMTNYDQLGAVLEKFNEGASSRYRLDVPRIVELRDQLAHGRTAATNPFPLTLLKFGKPVKGKVPVLARIDMTEAWFVQQRAFIQKALDAVIDEQMDWHRRRQG